MPNPTITNTSKTETFITLNFRENPLVERVMAKARPGYDGHSSIKQGRQAEEFQIQATIDATSAANADTKSTDFRDISTGESGLLVTLTKRDGRAVGSVELSFIGQQVKSVGPIAGNINAGTFIVRANFTGRVAR